MDVTKVDKFQILLILITWCLAFYLPVGLLLFVYAFVGPAHYLTQISWLSEKQYFTLKKRDHYPLWAFSAFLIFDAPGVLIIFPLSYALSIVLVKDTFFRVVAFSLFSIVLFYGGNLTGISLFYPFIPTLIHVYVFTSAFMLLGAIKSQSFYGYLSFYLLILGGISFFLIPGEIMTSLSGGNITNKIPEIEFIYLSFAQTFFNGEINLYLEKASRFAAFAYTYHYLNWFSKTGVIGWNKGFTRKHYAIITLLYLFFVGLFLYDYRLGFYFVSLLSLLHVLLELPLDIIVFKDLSKVLMKKRSLS